MSSEFFIAANIIRCTVCHYPVVMVFLPAAGDILMHAGYRLNMTCVDKFSKNIGNLITIDWEGVGVHSTNPLNSGGRKGKTVWGQIEGVGVR